MNVRSDNKSSSRARTRAVQSSTPARAYEAPRVIKKRSVARVTLFSGGGPMAGGLVATGG